MADLDDVPALLIVRECASRVHAVLLDRHIIDMDTLIMMTLYASNSEEWAAQWMSMLGRLRLRGEGTLPTPQLETWRREMLLEFAQKCNAWGNNPEKFAALHSFFYGSGAMNYWATNPSWYIRQMVFAGRFGIIDGDLDAGKTDCVLLMCENQIGTFLEHQERGEFSNLSRIVSEQSAQRSQAKGGGADKQGLGMHNATQLFIVSNIQIRPGHEYSGFFQFCSRLSDIIITISRNAMDGAFNVIVLDEMGLSYNKKRTMGNDNFAIEGIFRLIRKFNASVWILCQSKNLDLPKHLTLPDRGAKTIIEKKDPTNRSLANITVRGVPHLQSQRIREIPPTSLPYDTRAVASLAVDVDPRTVVESVEWDKQVHEKDHQIWDSNDTYRAIIHWTETLRQLPGAKDATPSQPPPLLVQQAINLLQTLDPMTGQLHTDDAVARRLGCAPQVVAFARKSLVQAPVRNPESKHAKTDRILPLLAKHTDEEIAGIVAEPVEFVRVVREADKRGLTGAITVKERRKRKNVAVPA